ncbi:MAG TPA: hypothetical protein VGM23_08335 [Armatimonadota bacterium]
MADQAILLETAAWRIVADPRRGGKIVEMFSHRLRRNLLAAEQPGAVLTLEDGAVFSVAGWDEAFPTLEPSGGQPTLGQAWRLSVDCRASADRLLTCWDMPSWHMEREIRAASERVEARYAITNTGDVSLPMLWTAHVLYPLEGLVSAELPMGRVIPGPGCQLEELEQVLRADKNGLRIADTNHNGKSEKFFLPAIRPIVLQYADACLTLTTDVPWWGIWLNCGVFQTQCLGIEPTTAPTDALHEVHESIAGAGTVQLSWQLYVQ